MLGSKLDSSVTLSSAISDAKKSKEACGDSSKFFIPVNSKAQSSDIQLFVSIAIFNLAYILPASL